MKKLEIGILAILLFVPLAQAGIGFGLTDLQQEITMPANENEACISYYLFNPGTVDIEGYLDIDAEKGDGLNKLRGLTEIYEELSKLEDKGLELSNEYKATVERGESTFEVEKKIAKLSEESKPIRAKLDGKKPKNRIIVPAGTRAKDENGNYQIPIEICFERPTEKYLFFFDIGDTDFCGEFKGEILGRFSPIVQSDSGGRTGSAVVGSRAVRLKIRVQCDVDEKGNARIKFALMVAAVIAIIILLILWIRRKTKRKQNVQGYNQYNQYNQT